MRNEITAAVLFLVQLIEKNEKFSPDQLLCFQRRLVELLTERFKNHWFPEKPFKGQGYRCIRVNGHSRRDATLESAANAAGVRYEDLALPVELTLWVDPNEVCCRFGETKGSYCTLASFDDKENTPTMRRNNKNSEDKLTDEQVSVFICEGFVRFAVGFFFCNTYNIISVRSLATYSIRISNRNRGRSAWRIRINSIRIISRADGAMSTVRGFI